MAAHQTPPSLGYPRQEYWSGWPFPSPTHESEKWKWKWSPVRLLATPWTAVYQDPLSMGFSRPRVQEWGAIAFSVGWIKSGIKTASLSQKNSSTMFPLILALNTILPSPKDPPWTEVEIKKVEGRWPFLDNMLGSRHLMTFSTYVLHMTCMESKATIPCNWDKVTIPLIPHDLATIMGL